MQKPFTRLKTCRVDAAKTCSYSSSMARGEVGGFLRLKYMVHGLLLPNIIGGEGWEWWGKEEVRERGKNVYMKKLKYLVLGWLKKTFKPVQTEDGPCSFHVQEQNIKQTKTEFLSTVERNILRVWRRSETVVSILTKALDLRSVKSFLNPWLEHEPRSRWGFLTPDKMAFEDHRVPSFWASSTV